MRQVRNNQQTPISCLIGTCSALKSVAADNLQASGIRARRLVSEWPTHLAQSAGLVEARDLYVGRAFRRMRDWAEVHDVALGAISAGIGLVSGSERVPGYDLTVNDVPATDRADWWELVQRSSPYATSWDRCARRSGLVLIALTGPYARLVGGSLAACPPRLRRRLRIFGTGILPSLAVALRQQVLPYDARLNSIVPGIGSDFASRALLHFANALTTRACPAMDLEGQRAWVSTVLAPVPLSKSPRRERLSDRALTRIISAQALHREAAADGLRALRRTHNIACEAGSFRRLREALLS